MSESLRIWGITSGAAGMEAQVKALASALEMAPVMKTLSLRRPFSCLPNKSFEGFSRYLLHFTPLKHLNRSGGDDFSPPWPDIVISCGRRAVPFALSLKRHAGAKTIHIGDPYCDPCEFDWVVAMQHDKIARRAYPNVIATRYALHAISPAILAGAKAQWESAFTPLSAPRIAALIGGSTHKYTLSPAFTQHLIGRLQNLHKQTAGSLLITTSRRTGAENIAAMANAFLHTPNTYLYTGEGENPYLGLLAWADFLVVTNDSVNMLTEAAATEKPIYILTLPGHKGTKSARFAQMLIESGVARALSEEENLEPWQYAMPDEARQAAEKIQKRGVFIKE